MTDWDKINKDKNDAILKNMAINNVEAKVLGKSITAEAFKKMVKDRFLIYKQIHAEVM